MAHRFVCEVQESSTVRGVDSSRSCAIFFNCVWYLFVIKSRIAPAVRCFLAVCTLLPSFEAHPTDGTEKRFALRLTLADCNCQCTIVLYHELVLRAAASMGCTLSETVHDTPAVRLQLRDLFRGAQWLCRFTFRENDYQQTLELECRHLQPCWRASGANAVVEPATLQRKVPHCLLNTGCPVAPLNMLQVDVQLGLICIGDVEASFVRALVAFNDVTLPDDEALQQDNTAVSAMRVKRSVDCLLCGTAETSVTHRAKLRSAGPASVVNWMLRGRAGEAHLVVLAHTEEEGEWSVLWHVPVEAHRVEGATRFLMQLYQSEVSAPQTITYDSTWTPMKRLAIAVEQTPEETAMAEDGA